MSPVRRIGLTDLTVLGKGDGQVANLACLRALAGLQRPFRLGQFVGHGSRPDSAGCLSIGRQLLRADVSLTPIVRHFCSLPIVALAISTAITRALLAWGRRAGPVCRSPESTDLQIPEWMKTFWFGNECNPELFGVDLKMFFYQPSLIGANLLSASFAFAQWDRHGFVTPQMLCLCFLWFTYLFTHYVKEEFMLSTWDVLAENLGFMLVWGDLTYLPFLYSLPGWRMVDATEPFSGAALALLVAFHFVALAIFRQSNWQKARFKEDPSAPIWGRPPRLVGGKLLASGYWGIGRKVNYTGVHWNH